MSSKRARAIMDGEPSLVESKSNKSVTVALEEAAQDKITYERTKTGIK
jgi:DNA-directed RNA polymerase subunit omega